MRNQTTEKEALCRDLQALGVAPGDVVLVHSSMKALGTKLTPEEVLDALEETLGEDGTLLLPALTYDTVTPSHPIFDSGETEPCIGLLPKVFWGRSGVERSVNPTHSVCAKGKLAHRLTVGHAMDSTAVGPHSPFMLLPLFQGKLLFIGEILESCTFLHGVEEIVMPPFLRPVKQTYTVNGEKREYTSFDQYGWGQEFQRVRDLLEEPDLRKGKLLNATAYLIDSRALLAAGLAKMRAEPYAFITDISPYI